MDTVPPLSPLCWRIRRDGAGEKWFWLYCPCVIFIPVQLRVAPPFPSFSSTLLSHHLICTLLDLPALVSASASVHHTSSLSCSLSLFLPPSFSLSLLAQFVFRAWLTQADFPERAWAQKRDKGKSRDGYFSVCLWEKLRKGGKERFAAAEQLQDKRMRDMHWCMNSPEAFNGLLGAFKTLVRNLWQITAVGEGKHLFPW